MPCRLLYGRGRAVCPAISVRLSLSCAPHLPHAQTGLCAPRVTAAGLCALPSPVRLRLSCAPPSRTSQTGLWPPALVRLRPGRRPPPPPARLRPGCGPPPSYGSDRAVGPRPLPYG
ncbi:exported protein of unknown function [Streptomyces ambofaciens ATCC 23877]|uniref:Uncharacterized protein n=1 Tax=Streptomyces ambofaciens (strain ATCC 23877 / 3486 / DSM 40053 / JCM 4204 / NBRC 12836 / NRRL B-2516) TaxID=278992 RepID=A0A0K2AQ51_STRA7|nr:exported protein of unknown function [Streptomyces ambofaciens ATCC 23877]